MECGGKAGVLIHGTYRPQSTNEVEAFSDANSMFLTEQEFEPFVPNLAAEEADQEAEYVLGVTGWYGNAGGVTAYARVVDVNLAV